MTIGDRRVRLPGFADVRATAELGRKLERLIALRAAGECPDPTLTRWLEGLPGKLRDRLAGLGLLTGRAAAAARKLGEHLEDYRRALEDGVASARQRGPATPQHAAVVCSRLRRLLSGIEAIFLSDITAEKVGRWLSDRRAAGLSAQSSNHYLTNAKSFCNWMIRAKRAAENPLAGVSKLQVTAKARRHVRRALEHVEAAALLAATRCGPTRFKMDGEHRYWLYRLALETALRSSELRSLSPESFALDDDDPHVYLPADDTKNRTDAELPLRPETVAELRGFLTGKPAGVSVFAKMPPRGFVSRMFRKDLDAAGLARTDDAGRVLDFHALRTTCLSWLAAAGVPLRTLQTFARHSSPLLTMNVYARTLQGGLADAAARLPD